MNSLQELISQKLNHLQPMFDYSLAPTTYMKIGGPAEVFFDLKTREDVIQVVKFCHDHGIKLTVLGGASNIIISSQGIKGVVMTLSNDDYQVLDKTLPTGEQLIRTGAGYKTALLVRQTIEDGFAGLEYFLGVPGKIAGAIYNNAHYLSDLVGKHIYRVEVVHPDGSVSWMTNEECQFAYDYSIFHERKDVIVQVEFALKKGDKQESLNLVKEATLYRARTQPLGVPSSGCYFRNTPNTPELKEKFPQFADRRELPTAYLIDQAGLKNEQIGGVKVSDKHAAFFVNTGGGTSEDIKQLADRVKQRVKEMFGVELKEEVFFLE